MHDTMRIRTEHKLRFKAEALKRRMSMVKLFELMVIELENGFNPGGENENPTDGTTRSSSSLRK